ncbi:MAG: thiolase domain-containing protein [Candidatus Cloacimonadota bacterium]|nr:MAG: thiolase domain-containing protein [Candidatus Cloacimonadota bacterium]
MREVCIIGAGLTRFKEHWSSSLRDLFVEAALKAIDDAKVSEIASMYVGSMSSGLFVEQEHIGPMLVEYLGVKNVPAVRVESACASGSLAFRMGFIEVASGLSDIVLVSGVEKMTDCEDVTSALAAAADVENEVFFGATFPALYALIARAHMDSYGTTREQLAAVSVKNHKNGAKNPDAQFQREVSLDAVLNSVMIADPLTILQCSPISDGAAVMILAPLDMAKKMTDKVVKITGSGAATDTIALHSRKEIASLDAVRLSAERAYNMARKKPEDIDVCEVHDCFSIAELVAIEELGFVKKGKSGKFVEEGNTEIGGKIPINTSGGLKAKGHPVGATGIAQIIEIYKQLTGNAGERQVKDAKIGMTQNMGGTGASSVVHIMEVV